MPAYSIREAQAHLPSLIRRAERGETITITRARIPVAMLVRAGGASTVRRTAPPHDAWSDAPHDDAMPAWQAFAWGGSMGDGSDHSDRKAAAASAGEEAAADGAPSGRR